MKQLIYLRRVLLSFFLLLSVSSLLAYDFEVDGIYYNIISESGKTVEVTYRDEYSGTSYKGEIKIPSKVNWNADYSVTGIGEKAFYGCRELSSVSIPNSITSIGERAFSDSGLSSISVPNSVTTVGSNIFESCKNLTSFKIPGSWTSVPEGCFVMSGLTSIMIPRTVTTIEYRAFYGCTSLSSITIPNTVTTLEKECFSWCKSLTSIVLPKSVTTIGGGAFSYCQGLTSISIPESVTWVGQSVFEGCNALSAIDGTCFLPWVNYSMFIDCTNLKTVNLSEATVSITDFGFYNSGVEELILPKAIKWIGRYSFRSCPNLAKIVCNAASPPFAIEESFDERVFEEVPLYVPAQYISYYQDHYFWGKFKTIATL